MRDRPEETASFDSVTAVRETPAALLCRFATRKNEEIWIPKSQIVDESEVNAEDDEGTLVVTQWIADQKGL